MLTRSRYAVALMANGAVTALSGGRVFDAVPRDPRFPYVVIGEADERVHGAEPGADGEIAGVLLLDIDEPGQKQFGKV